jgi:putative tricarboxylic transport membrane protein
VSDRIVGAVLFLLAIGYGVLALGYTSGFMTDPLGPSAFPKMLATLLAAASIYLIVRPDPGANWPRGLALLHQLFAVGILIAYAFVLEPIGFIPATFVVLTVLAVQLGTSYKPAAIMGAVASASLFVLFDRVLGLPLPMGTLFGD